MSIECGKRNTTILESQIDQLVYELYGLTEGKIGIVERELDKTATCAKFAQVRNEEESKVKAHPSTTLRIQHIIEIRN